MVFVRPLAFQIPCPSFLTHSDFETHSYTDIWTHPVARASGEYLPDRGFITPSQMGPIICSHVALFCFRVVLFRRLKLGHSGRPSRFHRQPEPGTNPPPPLRRLPPLCPMPEVRPRPSASRPAPHSPPPNIYPPFSPTAPSPPTHRRIPCAAMAWGWGGGGFGCSPLPHTGADVAPHREGGPVQTHRAAFSGPLSVWISALRAARQRVMAQPSFALFLGGRGRDSPKAEYPPDLLSVVVCRGRGQTQTNRGAGFWSTGRV